MSAPRYLRFGLLVLCLSITISSYAGTDANVQLTATDSEEYGFVSNGFGTSSIALQINSNSPLLAGTLDGLANTQKGSSKNGNMNFSNGGDLMPINPPLPPVENRIPEPNVLLDLGMGLAAFATVWNFRIRRSS